MLKSRLTRFPFAVALISVAVAILLSVAASPLVLRYPYLFFWPAVVIAVWYEGLRSGLLVIVLAAIIPRFYFHPDGMRFPPDAVDVVSAVAFVLMAGLTSWIVDRGRRADRLLHQTANIDRARAEGRTHALQQVTEELSRVLSRAELAEIIVQQAIRILGASAGSLALLTADKTELEIIRYVGYSAEIMDKWQRFSINTPAAPLATAVRTGQPVWINSQVEYLKMRSENTDPSRPSALDFQGRVAVPLFVDGEAIGAIGLSFITPLAFNEADKRFIMTLARQCEQALERSQLHENAKALAAQEERQRIARDLHDSVSQTLFAASVTAESLPGVWKRDPARMSVLLDHLYTLNRAAAAEMRVLLWELRPEVLESTSLTVLTSQLAYALKGRKDIQVALDFTVEDLDSLPSTVQIAFYRIAQEAINNIVKHAQASSVTISLASHLDAVELRIVDDGRGFSAESSSSGMGMTTMRERAQRIGASLDVASSDGNGTQVFVRWDRRNDAE